MVWKKKQFWASLIALALLAFCVKDIRLEDIQSLSTRIDLVYVLPAILCSFAFVTIKGIRWRLIVSPQKKLKAMRTIALYSAGQMLNITMPALTGQVGRLFLFSRHEGLRKTFVFSTIMMEVLFDAISLIVFLLATSVAFVFPEKYRFLSWVISCFTVVMLVLLYLFLHYQKSIEEFGRRRLRERWPGVYIGTKKFIRSFVKGIELLRSTQHFLGGLVYSLASWAAHALVVYFLLLSFGYRLPFAAAASVMIINTVALMIPITPGNAGTFEVAVSTSLAAFNVGRTDAVLFALALHLLDFLPIAVLGLLYLRGEKVSIRKISLEHEDEIIFDKLSEDGTLLEKEEKV